jgi:hypothetical protein
MRPNTSSAIYRPDLGQAVMEFYEGNTMGYIGLQLMPIYRTSKYAGTYPVIPKEALLKLPNVDRTPRGNYARGDWEYERGTFITVEKGWEEAIDDTEYVMMEEEAAGLADMVTVKRAWGHILRAQEARIAAKVFDSSTFTAHDVTTEWDTSSTCTPINDVKDAIAAFRSQCGMLPDLLVMSWKVFNNLQQATQIVEKASLNYPGIDVFQLNVSQISTILGVRVVVGGAVYDSTGAGLATTIADIWDDEYAALLKISSGMDLLQPGFGRTFLWTADSPSNPVVETYREEQNRSDIYRVRHHVGEELIQSKNSSGTVVSNVAAACIYLLGNITT